MTRLLLIAPTAYPLGGVAVWLDRLVPDLRSSGWAVTLGLLAGRHHDIERYVAAHPGEAFRPIQNPSGTREGRIRALARAIETAAPDLVLSVNVADIEEAIDRRRRGGAKHLRLATTQHAVLGDFFDHLRSRRAIVDGVICSNRLSTALAVEYSGCAPERAHYAPYGVDFAVERPAREKSRRLRIAWVGRFEESQKRVLDVAPICAELDRAGVEFELTLAGGGPEEAGLRERLENWTARGNVRFAGVLSAEEVWDGIYRHADVLLITSSWETGPIVAWEATSAGLAVASSRFLGSGLEGALVDGETAVLFDTGDARMAAQALRRCSDLLLRTRLVATATERFSDRYSRERSRAAWEAALTAILARPPRNFAGLTESNLPAGRLDRVLGVKRAQDVREGLRLRHPQAAPGDEWPHAYGVKDEGAFLALARRLDRAGSAEPTRGPV